MPVSEVIEAVGLTGILVVLVGDEIGVLGQGIVAARHAGKGLDHVDIWC